MSISENVTQEDLAAARTQNRAVLQEAFPDLDISVGGPVDSLLVDGNVAVSAQNVADTNRALLVTQLQSVASGEITVTDAELDRLMANYFLSRIPEELATGTVVFVVRDNRNYTFQTGYRLRASDQTYQLVTTYNIYPVGTSGVDFSVATNIMLQQIFDAETGYQYQFSVPISSLVATQDAVLISGDRLTVDQPFNGLGYVQATTNFSGGTSEETNQEFATRGLQGLLAQTVGGQDNILKLAQSTAQRADTSAIGTGDPMMTRDRNNVFNISTGGKVDIYVKSGAIAQAGYIVDATVTDIGTRELTLTLSREQSAGVYRTGVLALFLSAPPTIVSGSITVVSISHIAWTDPDGFNPEMPASYDRAFSARQQIVIVITDDRQDSMGYVVPLSMNGEVIADSYQVTTEYQPQILAQDNTLTSYELRPPGSDVLVKAAVPCITTVGVVAAKPVEYNGPTAVSLAKTLASLINALPIETKVLDALTISGLLREADPSLVLQSIALNGTIYGQNGTNISVSQFANKLTLPTNTAAKVSPNNTYFATTSALVTVTLV